MDDLFVALGRPVVREAKKISKSKAKNRPGRNASCRGGDGARRRVSGRGGARLAEVAAQEAEVADVDQAVAVEVGPALVARVAALLAEAGAQQAEVGHVHQVV